MTELRNKLVVITGAASGIGRALALEYLGRGARVAALDLDKQGLSSLPPPLNDYTWTVDVTDETAIWRAAREIAEKLGAPSIWINNAGTVKMGPFDRCSSADFSRVMRVNFDGVVYGTRAALEVMAAGEKEAQATGARRTIANIASINGLVPAPYMAAYTASKHAVVGFTRALQIEHELTHSPIQFALVAPGFVRTPIMHTDPDFALPDALNFLVESPEAAAREIVGGLERGKTEIYPTLNGKLILRSYQLSHRLATSSARLLTGKGLRQALGLEPIRK